MSLQKLQWGRTLRHSKLGMERISYFTSLFRLSSSPCRSFKIRMYQFSDIFCFCECKDSDRLLSGRLSGDGLCDRGGRKKFDLTLFLSVLVSCIDNKHAFSIVRIRTVYAVNILLASSRMYYSYRQCSPENVRSRNKSIRF